MTYRKKKR